MEYPLAQYTSRSRPEWARCLFALFRNDPISLSISLVLIPPIYARKSKVKQFTKILHRIPLICKPHDANIGPVVSEPVKLIKQKDQPGAD